MIRSFVRIWNTVKYLRAKQLLYQFLYKTNIASHFLLSHSKNRVSSESLYLIKPISSVGSYLHESNSFHFLNLTYTPDVGIDWNYKNYGKLWLYNLNYFDFLGQDNLTKEQGVSFIVDYVKQYELITDGRQAYPTSLRTINWIKFLTLNKLKLEEIDVKLSDDYSYLFANLEYHLLGNHLLENAYSLLFGAYYFKDDILYKKAYKLLFNELNEQILPDGAHFELSPMYHKILLARLLDCINLLQHNNWKNDNLLSCLTGHAVKMLGWLDSITYSNGSTPNINDATAGIAPSTQEIVDYAAQLEIDHSPNKLQESGYRLIRKSKYELLIDVGNIGPDYIPGHAHADTFNFELCINGVPVIVDTSISTYDKSNRRQLERSTISHNTVEVNGMNQSDVWDGFRVARRAKVIDIKETEDSIKASHDGYLSLGVIHTRSFEFRKNQIIITDRVTSEKPSKNVFLLHFHPDIKSTLKHNNILINDYPVKLAFKSHTKIDTQTYQFAEGFNLRRKSNMIMVTFNETIECRISIT